MKSNCETFMQEYVEILSFCEYICVHIYINQNSVWSQFCCNLWYYYHKLWTKSQVHKSLAFIKPANFFSFREIYKLSTRVLLQNHFGAQYLFPLRKYVRWMIEISQNFFRPELDISFYQVFFILIIQSIQYPL